MSYKQAGAYFSTLDSSNNIIPCGYKSESGVTVDFPFTASGDEDIFYTQVLSQGVYSFTLNYILQAVDASGCEVDYVQMTMLPAYDPNSNLVRWSCPNVVLSTTGERNTYSFSGIFNITDTTSVQFATEVAFTPSAAGR
jgi:hypothetical protein